MNFEQVTAYLEEKFGIVLDWTSETILPTLKELAHRIATYNIVKDSIIVVVCLIVIVGSMIFFIKEYKAYKESADSWLIDPHFGDLSFKASIITAVLGLIAVIAIILCLCMTGNLLNWIFIPEAQLFNYVKFLIG